MAIYPSPPSGLVWRTDQSMSCIMCTGYSNMARKWRDVGTRVTLALFEVASWPNLNLPPKMVSWRCMVADVRLIPWWQINGGSMNFCWSCAKTQKLVLWCEKLLCVIIALVHSDSDSLSFDVDFKCIWPKTKEPLRVKQTPRKLSQINSLITCIYNKIEEMSTGGCAAGGTRLGGHMWPQSALLTRGCQW